MALVASQETPSAAAFIARQRERWQTQPWVKAKDIQRNGRHWWRREAFTFYAQESYTDKVLVIERLRHDRFEPATADARPIRQHEDEVNYRIGYFVVSRSGKWWWGQYAPLIPVREFETLLRLAREEGTLLPVVTASDNVTVSPTASRPVRV